MNFNLCCFTGLSTGLLESDFSRYEKCVFPPLGMKLRGLQSCTWMWPDSHAWAGPMTNASVPATPRLLAVPIHLLYSHSSLRFVLIFWDQKFLPCAHSCFFEQVPHYWDLLDVRDPSFPYSCNKRPQLSNKSQRYDGFSKNLGRLPSSTTTVWCSGDVSQ